MPNFETPSETAEQKSARTGLFSRTNYWMANGGATDMDNLRANLTKDTKVPDAMMTALRADLEADATAHPDRY